MLNDGDCTLIFFTTAHNGGVTSPPPRVRASFTAMLMLEHTIVTKCNANCDVGMTISGHAAMPVIIAGSNVVVMVTGELTETHLE